MSKHTPGPWAASDKFGGTVWAGDECVAEVSGHDGTWEAVDANARLIAAAPEMLAALKAMASLKEWDQRETVSATGRQVMAAIAKAEGW